MAIYFKEHCIPHEDAFKLYKSKNFGVLATNSQKYPGFPHGSLVSYSIDTDLNPILYITDVAQHSRNFMANNKMTLTIIDPKSVDVQADDRVTLYGEGYKVEGAELEHVQNRHFTYHPQARAYKDFHDFMFVKIKLIAVRYIGGFAHIHWVDLNQFLQDKTFDPKEEQYMVTHVNQDHKAALHYYLDKYYHVSSQDVYLAGIDKFGFDIIGDMRLYRIHFEQKANTVQDVRSFMVAMAK
ncbi:MAG: DUF2470 domain-containing protein [Bacteroidia bacterium]|nr:DUF2470 domain-containing protein [Bacteroidia bacterium]MDW8346500.1 DUF2470 domain-containing protein [Bacteroidia bacterium]